jgi:hypothetical protein
LTLTPISGPPGARAVLDRAGPCTLARARAAGKLAVAYLGVVDALALRYRGPARDPRGLRQAAQLGLAKAIRGYCAERGRP